MVSLNSIQIALGMWEYFTSVSYLVPSLIWATCQKYSSKMICLWQVLCLFICVFWTFFSSGFHEDKHTYYVLNKGFLFQNMGWVLDFHWALQCSLDPEDIVLYHHFLKVLAIDPWIKHRIHIKFKKFEVL